MCRELTRDEVQNNFLDYVHQMVDYWEHLEGDKSLHDRLEGVVLSILVAIDGESRLPGFSLIPDPHPDNKQYDQENEDNWYPEIGSSSESSISGDLHERFYCPLPRVTS